MASQKEMLRRLAFIAILIPVAYVGVLLAGRSLQEPTVDKVTLVEASLATLGGQLELYRLHKGGYPTTEQGLLALVRKPMSEPIPGHYPPAGYIKKKHAVEVDVWGTPYVHESPGKHNVGAFDLSSLGADGRPGGEGEAADITNWAPESR